MHVVTKKERAGYIIPRLQGHKPTAGSRASIDRLLDSGCRIPCAVASGAVRVCRTNPAALWLTSRAHVVHPTRQTCRCVWRFGMRERRMVNHEGQMEGRKENQPTSLYHVPLLKFLPPQCLLCWHVFNARLGCSF